MELKFKSLALILALVVCSITLWLIESSLKYALCLFEVVLILILFYFLLGKTIKIKFETRVSMTSARTLFDYVFLAISMVLLIFNVLKLNPSLTLVCAIIVSFFLPGYVLLRLLKFNSLESWIEWLVLSFVLSIGITSIIFTVMLQFFTPNAVLLSAVYVGMSLCPLLKDRIYKYSGKRNTNSENRVKEYDFIEVLLLLWIFIFFIFVISSLYPQMSLRPGLDIVDHFSSSRLLILAPEAYSSVYPWFHVTWASVYELSKPSMEVFQTGLAYLSIVVMFSFYIMANVYLKNFNRHASMLATIFFFVFSGFGWLYFLIQKTMNIDISLHYKLLSETSDKSYWDIGYGQGWIWLWYRPLTSGLILLFVLLYLLRNHDLNKKAFIFIFSLILLALIFVHFPEAVIFITFLLFLSLLKPNIELRLKEAIISSFLTLFVSFILDIGLTIVKFPRLELLSLISISIISMSLIHLEKRPRVALASFSYWFTLGLSIIYVWLIVVWFITTKDFSVRYVSVVLSVPWQFYPVFLGLSGLFAISASFLIIKYYSKHSVIVFIFLFVFIILFGRAVTYFNINVLNTNYWERRLIPIAYAAASLLAPISVLELLKHIQAKKNNVAAILLISCLVISGITSTFLTLDLQDYYTSRNILGNDDLRVLDVLNSLPADKILLTITDNSLSVAEFAPYSWLINYYRYQLWSAKYPELPLNVLYSMNKPVCLLLREPDMQEVNKKYALSYLSTHFLPMFMESYSKKGTNVMLLPEMTMPSFDSTTMLILPKEYASSIWYAYDVLSLAKYNYTTVLIDDIAMLSRAETLIAPTEDIAIQLIRFKELFNLRFKNLLVLNLNGYGKLATNYFSGAKMTLSLDEDSKEKAYLLAGGSLINNITLLMTPLEFVIQSKLPHGNMFALLDDDLDDWVTSGIGSGNISIPRISLNHENKVFGNASISINVESGSYGYWQIAKTLPKPINVDEFNFISFYWYGRGDGKNYVLNFHSISPNNYWYSFKDTWYGWKKVLIPMHVPDGRYVLNGIFFVKVTNGNPSWSDIQRVEIRNAASNPNISGSFLIDSFGFESALSINVDLIAQGSIQAFRLLNFDGKSWNNIFELKPDVSLQTANFTLINGIDSKTLFGGRPSLSAKMTKEQDVCYVKIYIKLPPYTNDIRFSSVKMKIIPVVQGVKVKEILNETSSILLPKEITTTPLVTNKTVISWYDNNEKVPFSIAENLNGFKLVYINIYPLILDMLSDSSNYEILSKVLDIGGASGFVQKGQIKPENPVQGNLAAFQKVEFEGNITMFSNSSIIVESVNGTLELEYGDNRISNISRIIFFQGNNTLKAKNGSVNQGYGFYSNIHAINLIINSGKKMLGKCLLELDNGSSELIDIATYEVKIMGDSNVLMRQPTICIEGDSIFSKLYTYALLSKSIGILGCDATLQGKLIFKTIYGDTFTVVNDFIYEGKIISDYRNYNYDELSPLKQSFHILIVMFLFYLAVFLSIRLMRKIRIGSFNHRTRT